MLLVYSHTGCVHNAVPSKSADGTFADHHDCIQHIHLAQTLANAISHLSEGLPSPIALEVSLQEHVSFQDTILLPFSMYICCS